MLELKQVKEMRANFTSKQERVLIAYHANCIDGYTAAWVAAKRAAEEGYYSTLLPMSYDEDSVESLLQELSLEWPAGDYTKLYVLDYSLEVSVLNKLQDGHYFLDVVILDHHKTAFERYAPELVISPETIWTGKVEGATIILDNSHSGAGMAWRYFFSELEAPKLVMYVEDYDLYRFTYGNVDETKYINKLIKSYASTLENWDVLHRLLESEAGLEEAIDEGECLQEGHEYAVGAIVNNAALMELAGYKVPTVDCPYELVSDVGHTLAENSAEGFAATFTVEPEKCRIKWGLRSVGDFDVSLIAKLFGGGGHKNAAGFYTLLLVDRSQPEECISSSALPFEVCLDESN